jgi:hypothetical protein
MASTRSTYLRVAAIAIFVILMFLIMEHQRRRNVLSIRSFDRENIKSVIRRVQEGSGGFYSITTIDGRTYSFCPEDASFQSHALPGDSIAKSAYDDTLRIYNRNKNLNITFLK